MAPANSTPSPRDHVADANTEVARKKQRLSEEDPDSSPAGSIIIEADEPEDVGTHFGNAIEIEDDPGLTMDSYSSDFLLYPEPDTPHGHLCRFQRLLEGNYYVEPILFTTFTDALAAHVERTATDRHNWERWYLYQEPEFFASLAGVSMCLLDAGQLFERQADINTPVMRRAFQNMIVGLQTLCSRIIPFLHNLLKTTISRRDSMQLSTRPQFPSALLWAYLASKLLTGPSPTLVHLARYDERARIGMHMDRARTSFAEDSLFVALASTIRTLSGAMRDVKDSWVLLPHLVRLFIVCVKERQTTGNYPRAEVEDVLDMIKTFILPAICEKHPRALPDGFHSEVVEFGGQAMSTLSRLGDKKSAELLYGRFLKADTDAVICEPIDDESTATSLWRLSGMDQNVLSQILKESWCMQAAKAFILSDIMDIRNVGVDILKGRLVNLYNNHKNAPEYLDFPVIQYAVRFLRKNEMTAYIFGPESRAGLVNHSSDIICFLAATSNYTDAETDIIWRACSTSVEADFVKASFGVFQNMTTFLDFRHLNHLARKYSETPVSRLGAEAIDFLPQLFQELELKASSFTERLDRLALAFTSIDLLKHANASDCAASTAQLRHVSLAEIDRFARPMFQLDDRAALYDYCIPDIQQHTKHATTAFEILMIFISVRISTEEAQHVLTILPVSAAVEELCAYVSAEHEAGCTQPGTPGVIVRLSCVVRLMTLAVDEPDQITQERLFTSAFGGMALSNGARNAAWERLNSMAETDYPPSSASHLWQRYVQDYVPSLCAGYATPRLIEFMCVTLKAAFASEDIKSDPTKLLHLPLWETLVRFATASQDHEVVNGAARAILELLFDFPSTTNIAPASIAHAHGSFVRSHIQSLCSEYSKCIHVGQGSSWAEFLHGLDLLGAVLTRSRETTSTYTIAKDQEALTVGQVKDAQDSISFVAQIYGPGTEPTSFNVHARESTKVSELLAHLRRSTGATENRLIAGGREITAEPNKSLFESGVHDSGVIMIRPRYTFATNVDELLTCPGPVEQEISAQYSSLEAFMDGPEEIAQRVLSFLQSVGLSAESRAKVTSSETTAEELFPVGRVTRTKYSLFVLHKTLCDFARLGVADAGFIRSAIRRLTEVVVDKARGFQPLLMLDAMKTLGLFVQGKSFYVSPALARSKLTTTERAKLDPPQTYFEDAGLFGSRMLALLYDTAMMPTQPAQMPKGRTLRTDLAYTIYQTLLLACHADGAVWSAFSQHPDVFKLHNLLLLDEDSALSGSVGQIISNACQDTNTTRDVPDFYWRVITVGLSEALGSGSLSGNFFTLAVDVLQADQAIQNDEASVRSLIERLITELWSHQHTESPPLFIPDVALTGLLRLLRFATTILKSHKKPLNLQGLPTRLFKQFLFPPLDATPCRPLVHEGSRVLVYDLVRTSYESEFDYADLVQLADQATESSVHDPTAKFPGLAEWLRPPNICAGLRNLGMTCYMNSLLQQMFANLRFRKFVFSHTLQDPQKQTVLWEVQKLFARMQNNTAPFMDTADLVRALSIQIGVQEDVHTFYTTLLSRLEDEMPDSGSKAALTKFFTGKSVTQVKGECEHVSSRVESFTELSITVKNKASLNDSLDEFVQGEPLEGANRYKCMTCSTEDGGRLVNAMRRTCLEEIPDSLTFCLKRFAFDNIYDGENKVNDRFMFPKEIDMSRFQRSYLENSAVSSEPDTFELVGVIVHQGSLSYGHYWSYVRVPGSTDPDSSAWMFVEDSKALRCAGGIEEVQGQCFGGLKWSDGSERPDNAYVLFYQRKAYIDQAQDVSIDSKVLQSEYQLLPRVEVPEAVRGEIDSHNLWRHRIESQFNNSFSQFVVWLLEQYPSIVDARKGRAEPVLEAKEDVTVVDSGDRELEVGIGNLLASYVSRILAADNTSEKRLGSLLSNLKGILTSSPDVACHALRPFRGHGAGFTAAIHHRQPQARSAIFRFAEMCLASLQERDAPKYGDVLIDVLSAHSSLLQHGLELACPRWPEYFAFAADFAAAGPFETGIILESGYMEWAYEVLCMRCEPEMRKRHVAAWNWIKTGNADLSPLVNFLAHLLSEHVDLSEDPDRLLAQHGRRAQTESGWCLTHNELITLFKTKRIDKYDVWLLFEAMTKSCVQQDSWRNYPPGRLLGALVNENTHWSIVRRVEEAMLIHFDYEDRELQPLLSTTLHYCLNRSDTECRNILRRLSANLVLWNGQERRSLWFLTEAFKLTPCAAIETTQLWGLKFLRAKGFPSRQATAAWLQEHLFAPPPLSDDQGLDASRIRSTRVLVSQCRGNLQNGYNNEEPRARFESMLDAMKAADVYLSNLQAEVALRQKEEGFALGPEVLVEYDESKAVLAGLQQQLLDLSEWEGETTLPTRSFGVRKSVEVESEDVETSDGDLEEDFSSNEP